MLPTIIGSNVATRVKSEAFFHLTNNSAYLLTTIVALLMVPAILIRQRLGATWTLILDAILFTTSTASVLLFYIEGQRWARRTKPSLRELIAVLPVGIGISLRNAVAVIEGFVQRGGYFRRTPKQGDRGEKLIERAPRIPIGELLLALFFVATAIVFIVTRQWISLPFVGLFLGGYVYIAAQATAERISYSRSIS